ncbi:hypothetical protein AMS62_03235 [Bacillus sp. FJAT-18019]|nr:hypothetical protein AMS62_03235 [Bacillus sp. FJAT-18019]
MRPNYKKSHWKYFAQKGENLQLVSRKTKKAVKKEIDELAAEWDEYLASDEYKFDQLPACKWCSGGVCRDHPFDTGYSCPDCYGSGKEGWGFVN